MIITITTATKLQVPESVRGMLGQARLFFREEDVAAGDVLTVGAGAASFRSSSEKLYFIGSGSVELQVCYRCSVCVCSGCVFVYVVCCHIQSIYIGCILRVLSVFGCCSVPGVSDV